MPLDTLLMERFKVRTRAIENPLRTSIGTTPALALANNPNRLAWVLFNLHASQYIYLGLKADVSATKCIRVDPAGGHASMVWDEDFQMTAWGIWALGSGATTSLYVLEVVEY